MTKATNNLPPYTMLFDYVLGEMLEASSFPDFKVKRAAFRTCLERVESFTDAEMQLAAATLGLLYQQMATDTVEGLAHDYRIGIELKFREIMYALSKFSGPMIHFSGSIRCMDYGGYLMTMRAQTPNKFSNFVITLLDEFTGRLDDMVNSKDPSMLKNMSSLVKQTMSRMNLVDLKTAAEAINHRSAQFINMVNDPTSSFAQLSEEMSTGIVVELSTAEAEAIKELNPPPPVHLPAPVDLEPVEEPVKHTYIEYEWTDVVPPSFGDIVLSMQSVKVGSKEFNAKLKFYKMYIGNVPLHIQEIYYNCAARLAGSTDMKMLEIINKLVLK